MMEKPPKAKLPQRENDVAIAVNIAIGPRQFVFTPNRHDDRLTEKLRRVMLRIAERADVIVYIGIDYATMRYKSDDLSKPPRFLFGKPRELAAQLLAELNKAEMS